MAVVDRRPVAFVAVALNAFHERMGVWLSERRARHSRNLDVNRSAAIAVHDSHQTRGDADRGLQLFDRAQRANGAAEEAAAALYAQRFAAFDPARLSAYSFHVSGRVV